MALDGEHHRLTLRHGEETYTLPMLHDSVFNIYNELAAVAVLSEMGLSMDEICAALEATPLTKTRLDQIQVKGVAVVSMMAKSNNSLPVSMVFDYIRRKPGKKAVVGNMEYFCYTAPTSRGRLFNIVFRLKKGGRIYAGNLNCPEEEQKGMGLLLEAMVHVIEEMNR